VVVRPVVCFISLSCLSFPIFLVSPSPIFLFSALILQKRTSRYTLNLHITPFYHIHNNNFDEIAKMQTLLKTTIFDAVYMA